MSISYRIKTIVTSSGERLPILLSPDNLPMFEPTVFSLSEVRARNKSSNTIDSYLRSVMVLFLYFDLRKINLEHRLSHGQMLSLGEIEELVRFCRYPLEKIHSMLGEVPQLITPLASSEESLEKMRKKLVGLPEVVINPNSAATRLRNIRDYLKWMAVIRISKPGVNAALGAALESSCQYVSNAIEARLPSGSYSSSALDQREGLQQDVVDRILEVINPQSPSNPWKSEHTRYRNALIIRWLLSFGLRRGELLNVRIEDLNFRNSTVTITRRPDDSADPRKNQPLVKTRGREIPMSGGLQDQTNAYIMNYRSLIQGARKHGYLFVSSDTGAPLSIPSLNKIFSSLREKSPDLPNDVFPHIFRHTWNDRFSIEMDAKKVSDEIEKKTRSYLMGWSETSGTAATYTRRHIRKKAQAISLQMQKNILDREFDRE